MSGPSTLRICLAAMAPALTEAASARRKLQDSSVKNETLSVIKVKSNEENLSKDLQSGRSRANVTHLLLSKKERNGTCFDLRGSSPLGNSSSQTIRAPPNISTFPNINKLNIIDSHTDKIYASEAYQTKKAKPDKNIEDKKIMSLLQNDGSKDLEPSKIRTDDGDKQLGSCVGELKVNASNMVNGECEVARAASSEDFESVKNFDVKVDKYVKNGLQLNSDSRITHSLSENKLTNSSLKMGINLKHDQDVNRVIMDNTFKLDTVVNEKTKEDMKKECVRRQIQLERKMDNLLRRLKRMKGKIVEAHTKEQLRYFIKYQHGNLQSVAKAIKNEAPGPAELKEHFLSNEDVKNMSAAQLVKLVKSYQPNRMTFEDSVTSNFTAKASLMEPGVCSSALKTSEKLMHRVNSTSADLDSDATASSSGGESGDEDTVPTINPADLPPLTTRAEWKWAMDRAAIIARWTWLQAHVSDLEYRIRQQCNIYRQLRSSKGGVVLGDPPTAMEILKRFQDLQPKLKEGLGTENKHLDIVPVSEVSPCNVSAVMSNIDKQTLRLSQSLGNCFSPSTSLMGSPSGSVKNSVNGVSESPCSTNTDADSALDSSPLQKELHSAGKPDELIDDSVLTDAFCQSARCRPLRSYRKRKILKTIGLYKTNSKAARLSDIRCRCSSPMNPCAICGGRYNNTLTLDPDTMSLHEKVALLDPSFHPVLSFPNDIYLHIHCEGKLKSGLFQNKPLSRKARMAESKRQKVITLITEPVKKNNSRQNGRNAAASVINFTTKIKQKYEGKTKSNVSTKCVSLKPHIKTRKKRRSRASRVLKRNLPDDDDEFEDLFLEQEVSFSNSKENGLTLSSSQSSLKELREGSHRRRKVDNSYDINNIVIPVSMATSTRVEQPQYKEIVTPKWREIAKTCTEEKSSPVQTVDIMNKPASFLENSTEDEIEDLSDEKYAARHTLLEQEEKKRFRSFVQYPPVRRNRARSDAVTSVRSTSDRLSTDEGINLNLTDETQLPSHPSTPLNSKSFSKSYEEYLENQSNTRRRTISFSKRERSSSLLLDEVPNFPDEVGVKPWPRRTFPISESDYQLMVKESTPNCEPVHHQRVSRRIIEPSVYVNSASENNEEVSNVPSPHPSNESISSLGDDPNDPEWAGVEMSKRGRSRRPINDDVNDPEWSVSDSPRRSKIKR